METDLLIIPGDLPNQRVFSGQSPCLTCPHTFKSKTWPRFLSQRVELVSTQSILVTSRKSKLWRVSMRLCWKTLPRPNNQMLSWICTLTWTKCFRVPKILFKQTSTSLTLCSRCTSKIAASLTNLKVLVAFKNSSRLPYSLCRCGKTRRWQKIGDFGSENLSRSHRCQNSSRLL